MPSGHAAGSCPSPPGGRSSSDKAANDAWDPAALGHAGVTPKAVTRVQLVVHSPVD